MMTLSGVEVEDGHRRWRCSMLLSVTGLHCFRDDTASSTYTLHLTLRTHSASIQQLKL